MQRSILIILGAGAFLALLFFLGSRNPGENSPAAKLSAASALAASEDAYDFGEISMAKGEVSRVFTITNSGSEPLTLSRITTSCMCTTAYLTGGAEKLGPFGMPGHGAPKGTLNETIPSGESRTAEVFFDPAAHGPAGIGRISRAVFLEDAKGGVKSLEISATVVP